MPFRFPMPPPGMSPPDHPGYSEMPIHSMQPPTHGFYPPPPMKLEQKISENKASLKKAKMEKDCSEGSSGETDYAQYEDTIPPIEHYPMHPRVVPPGFDFLPPNMPPHPFLYD